MCSPQPDGSVTPHSVSLHRAGNARQYVDVEMLRSCDAGWWWLEHEFYFFHSVGNVIIPTDSYFSEGRSTTNHHGSRIEVDHGWQIPMWTTQQRRRDFSCLAVWISIQRQGLRTWFCTAILFGKFMQQWDVDPATLFWSICYFSEIRCIFSRGKYMKGRRDNHPQLVLGLPSWCSYRCLK